MKNLTNRVHKRIEQWENNYGHAGVKKRLCQQVDSEKGKIDVLQDITITLEKKKIYAG